MPTEASAPTREWLTRLPKAELHLHIEGTLEPGQMFALAQRNHVRLPYADVAAARAAYRFSDLQSFLDLYYQGMQVLRTAADFHDLAWAYFQRARAEGVVHIDLSFDPQAHLSRGISLAAIFDGLQTARREAEKELALSTALVMSFLRDRPASEALQVLEAARPWYNRIAAIGLDSAERGNPPAKFRKVFERAALLGIARTAHAGEEGPAANITQALDVLKVGRIDHGVRCLEDPALVARLRANGIPLTVCPLSNVSLRVFPKLADHSVPRMLDAGLNVSLNSDDPAYFGGGLLANYIACATEFGWGREVFRRIATNSVHAAFMTASHRASALDGIAKC
ncbi:MAG TPA: adenosine deaminase [Nevskiaceae bacterium]|nr:adenosine deaminase [Nevskiaceae bacterium]